jgi:hypothetical protein
MSRGGVVSRSPHIAHALGSQFASWDSPPAPSHVAGYKAAVHPLCLLCAAISLDLVVVVTGSGNNHNKIRRHRAGTVPACGGLDYNRNALSSRASRAASPVSSRARDRGSDLQGGYGEDQPLLARTQRDPPPARLGLDRTQQPQLDTGPFAGRS